MFFVGATGQLLTLILTVCLPFVFLVSGHHKIERIPELLSYDAPRIHTGVTVPTVDEQSISVTWNIAKEDLSCIPLCRAIHHLKPPNFQDSLTIRHVCLNASGNKAPPSFQAS